MMIKLGAAVLFTIIPFYAFAQLTLDAVYPTMGAAGQDLPITLYGRELNEATRVSITPDSGNRRTILGSVQTPGRSFDAYISETIAYVADGDSGLQIIDIRNPYQPEIIGSIMTKGFARSVTVSGQWALTANLVGLDHALEIIDVSNPLTPVSTGYLKTPGSFRKIAVVGSIAYIGDSAGLLIVDISDPHFPEIINSVETVKSAQDIEIAGNTAYIAARDLHILDISDPKNPILLGVMKIKFGAWEAAVFQNKVCLNDGDHLFTVLDVSDPRQPAVIGSVYFPGVIASIAISNHKAYVADFFGGIQVVDISKPEQPAVIGHVSTSGLARSITVSGNTAYAADEESGFLVMDVSYAAAPGTIGSVDTPGNAGRVAVSENIAYVADGSAGVQFIDISDPKKPMLIGAADTPGNARDVVVSGNLVYVADWDCGLLVIDVSDPKAPAIIGRADTPGYANRVRIVGHVAYIADGNYGLQVIDVSDPRNPTIIGAVDTWLSPTKPEDAVSVAVSGNYAYVVNEQKRFLVIDVSFPKEPMIITSVKLPGASWDVSVSGNYAYVVTNSGMQIIDISNPLMPVIIGSTGGSQWEVHAAGSSVFVIDDQGVHRMDISDPKQPIGVGSVDTQGKTRSMTIDDGLLYLTEGEGGLVIVPAPVEIIPTIFNASNQTITAVIPAPKAHGHYSIRIFNQTEFSGLAGSVTFVPPEKSYLLDTKAIIIVGTIANDKIFNDVKAAADKAFQTLLYQGYTKESIWYLRPDKDSENVDDESTLANVERAITQWVMQEPPASELLIYLADHGSEDKFYINEREILDAQTLSRWLNDLKSRLDIPVAVVYDACYSGTFIPKLSLTPPEDKKRMVMTSGSSQIVTFSRVLSFSWQFWDAVYRGFDLGGAFFHARDQMKSYQTAMLDANGNGIPNELSDEALIAGFPIRRTYRPQIDAPYIYMVSDHQTIEDTPSAKIQAGVSYVADGTSIQSVWAMITSPDAASEATGNPITAVDRIELTLNGKGKYEGEYHKFIKNGEYPITVCAMNSKGVYSLFRNTTVKRESNYIIAVNPALTVSGANPTVNLWAALNRSYDFVRISRVAATITHPNRFSESIDLVNTEGVYETFFSGFSDTGAYQVDIYAIDEAGYMSPKITTSVIYKSEQIGIGEPDEPYTSARILNTNQVLKGDFYASDDADWFRIPMDEGKTYRIQIIEKNLCEPTAALFLLVENQLTPVEIDANDPDIIWTCTKKSYYYYLRLTNADSDLFGPNVTYSITVFQPIAGVTHTISGTITDPLGRPIPEAGVITSEGGICLTEANGAFSFIHPEGNVIITAEADGHETFSNVISVREDTRLTIILSPINAAPGDINGDGRIDLKDAIWALKLLTGQAPFFQSISNNTDVNYDRRFGLEEAIYVIQSILHRSHDPVWER